MNGLDVDIVLSGIYCVNNDRIMLASVGNANDSVYYSCYIL